MEYYNLYKKGRYGWFHVTSCKFNNLIEALNYYNKEWDIKIGKELFNYKVTGL
jgi:hypothetical protein